MNRSVDSIFESISKVALKVLNYMVLITFIILIVSCITQVFTRYILNNSLSWTEELARYSFMYVNMLGAAICINKKSHARVTAIVDFVGPNIKKALDVFSDLVTLFISYVMIRYGISCTIRVFAQHSPAMRICMSFVYACIPIAGVFFAYESLFSLYRSIRSQIRKESC